MGMIGDVAADIDLSGHMQSRFRLLGDTVRIDTPVVTDCLLYTSPSPRDPKTSRMPSSA